MEVKTTKYLCAIYLIAVSIFMLLHRIWFSPEQFFIFAFIAVLFLGKGRLFLKDWLPFLMLFLSYEFLHSLVPLVSKNVHIFPMIHFDEKIFGAVTSVRLQALFYNPNTLKWYDYGAVLLYISHFVVPMVIGFIFWLKDRSFFKEYTFGMLILCYAAFVTYVLFPAMPPWMASNNGYIPPIKEVTAIVMSHFPVFAIHLPSIYSFFAANPVAAMPSLHAAFPMIVAMFTIKKFKFLGLAFIPYIVGVWFSVMYLGEHYLLDVIVGAIYAMVAFYFVQNRQLVISKIPIVKQYTNPTPIS